MLRFAGMLEQAPELRAAGPMHTEFLNQMLVGCLVSYVMIPRGALRLTQLHVVGYMLFQQRSGWSRTIGRRQR
jgi:hypothetical protein